jgi:pantothenate synthetase
MIKSTDMARLDYVSVAHPDTLIELDIAQDRALLSLAVFLGAVRLIDNMVVGT